MEKNLALWFLYHGNNGIRTIRRKVMLEQVTCIADSYEMILKILYQSKIREQQR
jgi:hypothetical protein